MSEFVDKFIQDHREYFSRNKKIIEANKWDNTEIYDEKISKFSSEILNLRESSSKDKDKKLKEIEKDIRDLGDTTSKNKQALFKQENELTNSILARLSTFISESIGDRHLKKTQEFIDETVNIIDIHIKKCNDYLNYNLDALTKDTISSEETEIQSQEVLFQNLVFQKKIGIQDLLSKLNTKNSNDNLTVKYYKNEKASLLMKEPLVLTNSDIRQKVDSLGVDWYLSDSKEFLINMKQKDIPTWNDKKNFFEQDKNVLQFWQEERNKIINGININGYFVHPWLYWHLNIFKTPIPISKTEEPIIHPTLRDNEFYFVENLKQAEEQGDKGLLLYGSRRFAKSVILASYIQFKAFTKANSVATVTSGSSADLTSLTHKIQTSMIYMPPALKLEIQSQDWEKGDVILGLKTDASNTIEHSRISIKNLTQGATSSTQKTAGGAPSAFVNDEIGKYAFLKSYLAAIPSFKTPYGFKCVPMLVGTGGEADLSADAVKVLSDPTAYSLLPMNWDLLENNIDPEHITWYKSRKKSFATFIPAQMSFENGFIKQPKKFSDFLKIESEVLDKIIIGVTDWGANKKLIEDTRESKKNDSLLLQQEMVQYPIDPEECFMSTKSNPFPALEAKQHKDFLIESGMLGKKVVLMTTKDGKITYDLASDKPLADFPFQGGNIDAPVVLFEDIPTEKPSMNLYVAGLDDYKQDKSDSDSVGSFTIYKVDIGMDEWCGRPVASYHSRPDQHSKFHRQGFMLLQAFNAKCFMENEDILFKEYLDRKYMSDTYLAKGFDFAAEMQMNYTGNRPYGWQPTSKNKNFLFGLLKKYANEEITIKDSEGNDKVILGVQRINDIGILDEMINYQEGNNVDKLTSFMSALGYAFYLETTYQVPTALKRRVIEDIKSKIIQNKLFTHTRRKLF